MNIPGIIKIGGIFYDVNVVDEIDSGESAGKTLTHKQEILISKGKQDFMNVTLLHEILHAINMELSETDTEFLSQAIYQVINDNREIFS